MDNLELLLTEELQLEFLEYLKEDQEFENFETLNEEILNEGKLLNKIRWKLALFSLRFLKESSLNDFLKAYYSDKEGNPTEKSEEWLKKSKKEKLKKIRELANDMKQEDKDKIANSQQAKQLEAKGAMNFVYAGISGASAGIAYKQMNHAKNAINDTDTYASGTASSSSVTTEKIPGHTSSEVTKLDTGSATISGGYANAYGSVTTGEVKVNFDKQGQAYAIGDVVTPSGVEKNQRIYLDTLDDKTTNTYFIKTVDGKQMQFSSSSDAKINAITRDTTSKKIKVEDQEILRTETNSSSKFSASIPLLSTLLTSLASLFFGVMWGSIILAGVNTVKGFRSMHKANTFRRDEIMSNLLKNSDKRTLKECLDFLHNDLDAQKQLIEMYQTNDTTYSVVVENIKQQNKLKTELTNIMNKK